MTSFDPPDEEWFDVSDSPDSVMADAGFESVNVCRVAALSTMLGAPLAFTRQVAAVLGELGFSAEMTNGDRDYRRYGHGLVLRRDDASGVVCVER